MSVKPTCSDVTTTKQGENSNTKVVETLSWKYTGFFKHRVSFKSGWKEFHPMKEIENKMGISSNVMWQKLSISWNKKCSGASESVVFTKTS